MSYTTICRTTYSFLNQAPALLSKRGHTLSFLDSSSVVCNGAGVTGLLTSRRFASISKTCGPQDSAVKSTGLKKRETSGSFYSHNRLYGDLYGRLESDEIGLAKLKSITLKRLQDGLVQVAEQRNVTSLPRQFDLDNAQYIALDAKTLFASPSSGLCSIHAVSGTEQLSRICRLGNDLPEHLISSMGLNRDDNGNVSWSNGQPLDTVGELEALREFINFSKKYKNAVLLIYDGPPSAVQRVRISSMKLGLYDEFISLCPFYIDVFHMLRRNIPRGMLTSFKLSDVCKQLLDMDVDDRDPISRLTGLNNLFDNLTLERGIKPYTKCTDYFCAKDCYATMIANNQISVLAVEKLATSGLRLDHLKFLKKQGEDEFKTQLRKYSLHEKDIEALTNLI